MEKETKYRLGTLFLMTLFTLVACTNVISGERYMLPEMEGLLKRDERFTRIKTTKPVKPVINNRRRRDLLKIKKKNVQKKEGVKK